MPGCQRCHATERASSGLDDNIWRYTNSFVTHDAVPAQYMSLHVYGGVPISISAPRKCIRFLRLRDSIHSHSKRRCQDQEQSAAWFAACGTAFSNKPSHPTLGSVLRISSLIPYETLDVSVVAVLEHVLPVDEFLQA